MDERTLESQRAQLLRDITAEARNTRGLTGRGAYSDRVMAALASVPREAFMPPGATARAYTNRPQSIGCGQTISQPYIVALMTDLLDLKPQDRVLEIGTGSGYQAAILSQLVSQVFSVEVISELAGSAGKRLVELGYANISILAADGRNGWPAEAPFDAIMVTAVAEVIPPQLIAQLGAGGCLIAPVGKVKGDQQLVLGHKDQVGVFTTRDIIPVAFVPLV